jgi:hypothetical protein
MRIDHAISRAGRRMRRRSEGHGEGSCVPAGPNGWSVDIDVVLPVQGDELINNAVMRFEQRHPVMLRCLEPAEEKGRSGGLGPPR